MTRLAPYSLFAGVLAMAGLPIYIHAPKFYADSFGVSLASLGAVLFALRLLDFVQDPALGWLSRRLGGHRRTSVALACAIMAMAMFGLFAMAPPVAPLLWFAITLTLLFSAFSFLTITFYAQGVTTAKTLAGKGHLRLAGWRETGALIGVSLAALAPLAFGQITENPFFLFAGAFTIVTAIAVYFMRSEWSQSATPGGTNFAVFLQDPLSRRLLLIALLNAMPVAVTSTLFLFFVEARLEAPGWEGPLLLLFFLAAAASAPVWTRLAVRHGAKSALMAGMSLAILAFAGAAFLGSGDVLPFAVISIASGAAVGADLTLLPAIFSRNSAEIAPDAAEGFGLWSFASKASLAFAAAILLPALDAAGFQSGASNQSESALIALTFSYAILPLILKLAALALLAFTPLDGRNGSAQLRGALS